MDNYSATTSQDMFVPYEMTTYDEEDSPERESSSKFFVEVITDVLYLF